MYSTGNCVQHRELCSAFCGSLDGREVWGRVDTCICVAESLCRPPETITTLLTGYTQYKIVFFFFFKNICGSHLSYFFVFLSFKVFSSFISTMLLKYRSSKLSVFTLVFAFGGHSLKSTTSTQDHVKYSLMCSYSIVSHLPLINLKFLMCCISWFCKWSVSCPHTVHHFFLLKMLPSSNTTFLKILGSVLGLLCLFNNWI